MCATVDSQCLEYLGYITLCIVCIQHLAGFFKGPGDLSYFFKFMVDRIISLLNLDSLGLTINSEKSVVTLAITI